MKYGKKIYKYLKKKEAAKASKQPAAPPVQGAPAPYGAPMQAAPVTVQ